MTSSSWFAPLDREGAVGLRIVGDQLAPPETDRVTVGPIEVAFDIPPASITESLTTVGHQLHLSWSNDQVEARVTIADPR